MWILFKSVTLFFFFQTSLTFNKTDTATCWQSQKMVHTSDSPLWELKTPAAVIFSFTSPSILLPEVKPRRWQKSKPQTRCCVVTENAGGAAAYTVSPVSIIDWIDQGKDRETDRMWARLANKQTLPLYIFMYAQLQLLLCNYLAVLALLLLLRFMEGSNYRL